MRIGVPKETKDAEKRVGLTPNSVAELIANGHQVFIESGAGAGIRATDTAYQSHGAVLMESAQQVFQEAELIVKVKEPQPQERALLTPRHTLFTYLHLAPDPVQTEELVESGATCIAYETVTDASGGLPLLAPMSQIAGKMSVQAGAHALEAPQQGAGLLLGGIPGVAPATVVIIGGGQVGISAAEIAVGMGAEVVLLDRSAAALNAASKQFGNAIKTIHSTKNSCKKFVLKADVVIGAVLIKGAKAPHLVSAETISRMKPGSVIVDVAIDQGGCIETSVPTTHSSPTYVVDDVVHYCVTNMPGAVPQTATYGLNNATLPFVLELANKGIKQALEENPHLQNGCNVANGYITEPSVATALQKKYLSPEEALRSVD